jgi:hypothetical protein
MSFFCQKRRYKSIQVKKYGMLYKTGLHPRMHTPDLNLASSYIPACLCMGKALSAFIFFIFAPTRGWIAIASMLSADRILWNKANSIMDVNAVCSAMISGLMVASTRVYGVHSGMQYVIVGPWILLSLTQILAISKFPKAYEIIYAACAISILSCLHQQKEDSEFIALRAFTFVVANTTLLYLNIAALYDDQADTYVHVCRTYLILMGEWHTAVGWVFVCALCAVYQLRSRRQVKQVSEIIPDTCKCPDETGLLREALARKGFSAPP